MLVGLLGNRFIGMFAVVLSLLVFNIGIAAPLFNLALANSKTSTTGEKVYQAQELEDFEGQVPLEEEDEEESTPTPPVEEEDEKPKETTESWKFFSLSNTEEKVLAEDYKLPHISYEVTTPPPETLIA